MSHAHRPSPGPARVVVALLLLVSAAGCGAGAREGDARPGIPRALRARATTTNEEVVPFSGFAVVGLHLYRVSGAVPDHGWSYVVGVDAQDRLYEGPALMARLGVLDDDVFARRATAILLREADHEPVDPESTRPQFVSEEEWALVRAPRREGEAIVFYLIEGEMAPTLVEIAIDATTFAIGRRTAVEALIASGRTVTTGTPVCQVFARCGCFDGCRRFTAVRVPPDGALRQRLEGEDGGALFAPCEGASCGRVCRADVPDATCDPLLVRTDEPCTEACPPAEAPFHCETLEGGCREVPHPTRAAATPATTAP